MDRSELINEIKIVLDEYNPVVVNQIIELVNQFCDELQETTNTINSRLEVMGSALDGVLRELKK